jgi:hypothetical protein
MIYRTFPTSFRTLKKAMVTLSKDDIELSIARFRADEQYHKTNSEFSVHFDDAITNYVEGNFARCASILINCFRIAEGELRKEDYKINTPLRSIEIYNGGGSVWDSNKNEYYLGIAIDTLHDASIVMLLADEAYSPGPDIFALEPSFKTTKSYKVKGEKIGPYTPISVLLTDLMDPLGDVLKDIRTTREAAFILAQACLRKIGVSYLRTSESDRIENQIAGMICVMTLANNDQNWKSNYGLVSLQNARGLAHGRAVSGIFIGSNWIKKCVDDFEAAFQKD